MPRRGTPLEYSGEIYTSISALAKKIGVTGTTLGSRLREGLSVNDAVRLCIENKSKEGFDYKGVHYTSLDALAEAYNINECSLKTRIYKFKMPLEEAVERAFSKGKSK